MHPISCVCAQGGQQAAMSAAKRGHKCCLPCDKFDDVQHKMAVHHAAEDRSAWLEKCKGQLKVTAAGIPAAARQPTYGSGMGLEGATDALAACTTSWPGGHAQLPESWLHICACEPLDHHELDAFDMLLIGTAGNIVILQTCQRRLSCSPSCNKAQPGRLP